MPISTPVGPLTTLDELASEAVQLEGTLLEAKHRNPVFVITTEADAWTDTTVVDTADSKPPDESKPLPALVFTIAPGRLTPSPVRLAVGRSSVCEVVLPFAAVSKVHAYLTEPAPHRWQIQDAGSTNGTAVDGVEAPPNAPVPLRDGSTVEFGRIKAKFWLPVSFCAELRRRSRDA